MEEFTIETCLDVKEYRRIMFVGLYRRATFMVTTIVGAYLLITVLLDHLRVIDYYPETPVYEVICGLFLVLAPTIITMIAVNQFKSNPSFGKTIKYTFGDNGVRVEGLTFKSEFQWEHIIKQKEVGKYLVLGHTKRLGNFIDKSSLTVAQLNFIKSKIKQGKS